MNPNESDYPFFHPIRVRYSEVDSQGVVFNANYLNYFDVSLNEYMRHLKYDYLGESKRTGLDFMVTRSVVDFKSPARFDEEILVGVRAGTVKPASVVWEIAVFKKESKELVCVAELTWACLLLETRKPVKLPEAFANLKKT
ncbi:thioesterase [Leptospira perolatii]|uniref:Thioesterase n=1 Tax=Leptospira perolatii TaxID=2023191 RepID=A0A2M9ZP96_9LEPT|nr:thioesterase family protein [Leptospira perolatii]PJZ70893.1 thioesterase [Leptospira perolatii]PJZ73789.1 thioesterase [Leptospira perolatii]